MKWLGASRDGICDSFFHLEQMTSQPYKTDEDFSSAAGDVKDISTMWYKRLVPSSFGRFVKRNLAKTSLVQITLII